MSKVCLVLNDEVWNEIEALEDIEGSAVCLNLIMKGVINLLIPIKRRRVKSHPPMWNLSVEAKKGTRTIREGLLITSAMLVVFFWI